YFSYKPSQLYLVISDVKKYNEFLPYCKASEVYKLQKLEDKSYMEAKLTIGFLNFEESYTSKVKCWENKLIIAQNENSNLFKTLTNRWEIESYGQGSRLKFHLDFELNSPLYHSVAKLYFESIASEMVKAFESRCQQLYSQ
ncbi:oligoketide cyclase/lipid transport protein, partial [Neoconidiobolus thromboides FSU 785]